MAVAQEQARQVLLAREEAAVEGRVWSKLVNADSAEVITGGDPLLALARLEEYIGETYGSLGVIHMTRIAAAILVVKGLVEPDGRMMKTKLGTPVIVGTGYTGKGLANADPAANTQYIAASPALFGYRSEEFAGSNFAGDLMDRQTNDVYGIYERNYLIGFDPCGVALAPVNLGV